MRVLILAFAVMIALVAVLHILSSQQNTDAVTRMIQQSLEAKGRILVQNNSFALSGMVADNAFLGVQELVVRTVADDPDVVYGIFMDADRKTWVYADETRPGLNATRPQVLDDSISRQISREIAPIMLPIAKTPYPWIEFSGPVFVEGEIAGYIRYGLSTGAMVTAAESARRSSRTGLLATLFGIGVLGLLAIAFSFLAIRRESRRLSQPIIMLDIEAKVISGGHYSNPVHVESDDEIGELASSFEEMRKEIKRYTDHLEEIISQKMQQVRDILDHIDQGLFTVNFDGSINEEYSLATEEMLAAQHLYSLTIQDALGMSPEQQALWVDWMTIVQQRHKVMRWEKLARLSPIHELSILHSDGRELTLHFEFQKILSKDGELARIMVLVHDVTEARRIERIVREEQAKHENEVRTILGLVNTVPELIHEFFRDIDERIRAVEGRIVVLRRNHALEPLAPSDGATVAAMFRDLHTVKGNASSYGFEELGRLAHQAEDDLERLRSAVGSERESDLETLELHLREVLRERKVIDETARMLHGGMDGMMVSIAERKIVHVQKLARTLIRETSHVEHNPYSPLLLACDQLRRVPFIKIAEKYSLMVERLATKLGKQITFQSSPAEIEVEPLLVVAFNDCLVQLIRNAVDHGIEPPEVRKFRGKGPQGRIWLVLKQGEDMVMLEVHDDGCGVDPDKIAEKALGQKLITAEQLREMDRRLRMDLIFLPGFSTRDQVSDVSGRGVGLDVVRREIEKQGGRISLESVVGKGSMFRIEVPRPSY